MACCYLHKARIISNATRYSVYMHYSGDRYKVYSTLLQIYSGHYTYQILSIQLCRNRTKSQKLLFVMPRSCRKIYLPSAAVEGFARVQEISSLRVTLTYSFSVTNHISNVNCAVSFTFTYHTWQTWQFIIFFFTIFTITTCIFSYSFSLSLST